MEITKALIIVSVNALAFITGLLLGRTVRKIRNSVKNRNRYSLNQNNDWQTLVNYYPSEPTENLSLYKPKGEKLWKKKQR